MARPVLARLGARSIEIPLDGDGLPTAFRLFSAGPNETTKGTFLFDDEAARLVMAAATEHGVDCMLDLEHLSLDQESNAYDPDARAWFQLEVRNGELWAVNVRWTDDGARRLREKTQRYISPAFSIDDEGRVTEIVNVALVAMPATHGTPALVAANRRPRMKTLKDRKNELAARLSIAKQKIAKLADGEGDAPSGKFAAVQAAAMKAGEALAALDGVSGVDEAMGALDAALAAVKEFEDVAAAMGAAAADAPATDAAEQQQMADKPAEEQQQMSAREKAELIALRADKARAEEEAKVAKLAAEMQERSQLENELVKLGRETPATVKLLSNLSLADLRKRVEMFRGAPTVLGRVEPPTSSGVVAASGGVELGEFEVARVHAYADERRKVLTAAGQGHAARSNDEVLARYVEHKSQQLKGAKSHDQIKRLGRRIEAAHVLLTAQGRLVTLASTPVQPIEEFGASSQRALEEFRLNYNMALAAEPKVWAETIGDMLPGGSLRDTYPINFSSTRYVEKTAQGPGAETSNNVDVTVTKREFYAAEQVELRRLTGGDFAYVMAWNRNAERMARARVALRNSIVTTILEAGESGYWGYHATNFPTGFDGQPFFSATHKVNPFDASKKLRGVATWGNFQSSATVLTAANLTAEKANAFNVADPAGREFGYEYDALLVPSALNEVARNLLTVQDLILEAGTVNGVSNAFGATSNPHRGMDYVRAPELAGSSTSADWYLISRAGIAAGLFPWVISEDAAEDLRVWDESSDFYKDSGLIKVSSHIFANAALLYPHAIRKVSGT